MKYYLVKEGKKYWSMIAHSIETIKNSFPKKTDILEFNTKKERMDFLLNKYETR